tara:strand:- start:73 stop:519 length:447 start_codon:yes stop_codon:yes gene_type:complete
MKTTNAVIAIIGLIALLMAFSGKSEADEIEYRLNIGLFTEHYLGRSGELNEKNKLIQISAAKDGNVLSAASFVNSYFTQSYLVGAGRETRLTENLRIGGYVVAVKGYDGHIKTHYEGILLTPVVKFDYYGFTLNVMPAVYSVGYEFKL